MNYLLSINGIFPTLNDYIDAERQHRLKAAEMKRTETYRVKLSCLRLPKLKVPIRLDFVWIERNNRRDPDNVVFAKKFVLDGLVLAGVIPDDSRKWIKGWTEEVITNPTSAGVQVTIIPQEEK